LLIFSFGVALDQVALIVFTQTYHIIFSQLDEMHKKVHQASLSSGKEISDLRFALNASKTHIKAMEHRIHELTEYHKQHSAKSGGGEGGGGGTNDWVEVKTDNESSERMKKLESQITSLSAERQKLVHALDTAKGHIIKLTARLSTVPLTSTPENQQHPHSTFMKTSVEVIAPGEVERQRKEEEEENKRKSSSKIKNPLQFQSQSEENEVEEEEELRQRQSQKARPSFFESFFG
jgi:hypothetical protein